METQEEKIKNIETAIERIVNKRNKIMFYLPSMPQASGGIGVVYQHVKILTELGFNALVLHDSNDYKLPTWLNEEYSKLKHVSITDKKNPLPISMDDILVIPEGFSNIMESFKNMPCKRIVLCQSYLYVLGSLIPSMGWDYFGIRDVIVVTPTLQTYLERVFGKRFNIKICRPSIDNKIFKPSEKPKKPVIAISARDAQHVLNISKHFYSAYPQYKWVSFKHMLDMTREDFADTLSESCLAVWVDRIAGFGTFPIECAKSNVPFIGLIPDILPEYAKDNSGIWTNNILDIPDLIAGYFRLWFEDNEPKELLEGLQELSKEYTTEEEVTNVTNIYSEYIDVRKAELEAVLEKIKTEE